MVVFSYRLVYVPDDNEKGNLQFNLPPNCKKDILFGKLPYIALLDKPAIDNVVK